MARVTSIELADDAGTLVGATVHGTSVIVNAVERFDRRTASAPGGVTRALQQARGMLDLPRRTRVVLWDGRAALRPESSPVVQTITEAGFEIERIVSPCDALAALARTRHPRPDATILWVAINRTHVAIVVMRPGRMFYSRSFAWDSTIGAYGSQARLLQRYTLVAWLTPELQRAISATRGQDAEVDGVITCGNLPDLRSLTMPLIEELDLEVETLDSAEGLHVDPPVRESVTDLAPAIRLAVAGAVARTPRPRKAWIRVHAVPAGIAAAAAVVAAGAWWWHERAATVAEPAPRAESSLAAMAPAPADVNLPAPAEIVTAPPAATAPPDSGAAVETAAPPASSVSQSPQITIPKVTAILTSDDRRMALVDGRVVGVGDAVGAWRVAEIEPRTVVLRDASGAELRVPLGGKDRL
jgi:hypothetical protein